MTAKSKILFVLFFNCLFVIIGANIQYAQEGYLHFHPGTAAMLGLSLFYFAYRLFFAECTIANLQERIERLEKAGRKYEK